MIKIIYKKRNGEIFERIRNTYSTYRVGDITSMGWEVLNVLYKYKSAYYPKIEYDDLINKEIYFSKLKTRFFDKLKKVMKNINKIIVLLILFKYLESLVISGL